MAVRRPIVIAADGKREELPDGDTLAGAAGPGTPVQATAKEITAVIATTAQLDPETTAPSSTNGTFVDSHSITLTDAASQVRIDLTLNVDTEDDGRRVVMWVLRGTTVVGIHLSGNDTKNQGGPKYVRVVDTPGSVGPHTYNIRIATSNTTLYVNRIRNSLTPFLSEYATWVKGSNIILTEIMS